MKWPEEAASYGPVRLAIIPIGAFRFYAGQMSSGTHIGPRDAVKIFEGLKASYAIPIHWGTFRLSYEAYDTPPRMLDLFVRCAGLSAERSEEHKSELQSLMSISYAVFCLKKNK